MIVTATGLTGNCRPKLARGVRLRVDEVRGRTVLLAPERTVALDETGTAILRELDGVARLDDIIARLARTYSAPAEVIGEDVIAFLGDLADRRFLDVDR